MTESRIRFEERTNWAWWAHMAIGLTFLAAVIPLVDLARGRVWGHPGAMPVGAALLSLALGLGLPAAIYFLMGQLRVRITYEGVEAVWGFGEVIRKRIPFEEMESVRPVTYSPLREFGGWGIRAAGGKKRAWTVRGNRALLLHLRDGTDFYLGSERPERLLGWVQSLGKGRMAGDSSRPA